MKIPKIEEFNKYDRVVEYIEKNKLERVFGGSYQMSSNLYYRLKRPVYKLAGVNRFDHYDMMEEARPAESDFVVVLRKDQELPPWLSEAKYFVEKKEKIDESFFGHYIKIL